MADTAASVKSLLGTELGYHVATYADTDAILYALAVGAAPSQLDLVYERNLRVLPTMACALGLWAVEAAARLGAYDPQRSLHAAQRLQVHSPLPAGGSIEMRGSVSAVWDKGRASIVEIDVESSAFNATYSIFVPEVGGWGGERGPSQSKSDTPVQDFQETFQTTENLAALYRLTGDRHPVHIDPSVAAANGFDRPILHGLCTLGIAARIVAEAAGHHPCDLRRLEARLAAPVLPGQELTINAAESEGGVAFDAVAGEVRVISGGFAAFDG